MILQLRSTEPVYTSFGHPCAVITLYTFVTKRKSKTQYKRVSYACDVQFQHSPRIYGCSVTPLTSSYF